jgi:starch synthase
VGWGETSALALACAPSAHAALVVPDGRWDQPLSDDERAELDPDNPAVAVSNGMLVGLGAIEADLVILPCPSATEAFLRAAEMACRASDQPVTSLRFGCDELPHDPATDPALAAAFSPESPAGKQECRRAIVRRTSLAAGPRTLLLATGPLDPTKGGREILETVSRLGRADVAVVFPAGGDRALVDQANVLAIRSPGKVTIFPELGWEAERQILAAADAMLLADAGDLTGRPASLALRYGALPLAPDAGASGDYLVDCDVASQTGCGLLYAPADPWGGVGAIQRASALRANAELWQPLLVSLMRAAPRWSATAASLEAVCLTPRAA